MDYDSDTYDEYVEFSVEIIEEMKEDSQLKSISLFKDYISREPEFTGIGYISSYDLLQIFQNPKKCKCKCKPKSCISNYQLDLLKDLTSTLFDKIYSEKYYDTVCDQIFAKIYI